MKLSSLRVALRGRTSRSPRMSCSLMTATLSVSKPDSMPTHRQHRLVARRRLHRAPGIDAGEVEQLVIPQHAAHAVARAFAPQRDHHLLALGLQRADMRDDGFEHVDGGVCALRREVAARPRAGIDHAGAAFGHRERRQPRQRGFDRDAWSIRLRSDRAGPAATACRSRRRRDAPSPRAAPRNNRRSA